jgi:hypothetical protein
MVGDGDLSWLMDVKFRSNSGEAKRQGWVVDQCGRNGRNAISGGDPLEGLDEFDGKTSYFVGARNRLHWGGQEIDTKPNWYMR